jgi:hypothetical protein
VLGTAFIIAGIAWEEAASALTLPREVYRKAILPRAENRLLGRRY